MKYILNLAFFISLAFGLRAQEEKAASYLQKIRNNEGELTAFMAQMPKGGDLHHHFSGSIYAEPLLAKAIQFDYYLNMESMAMAIKPSAQGVWKRLSSLASEGRLEAMKNEILRRWSVKDYYPGFYPSDQLFFESFDKYLPVLNEEYAPGMLEIKNRALAENVSYIETMFSPVYSRINLSDLTSFDGQLRQEASLSNDREVLNLLENLYTKLLQKEAITQAVNWNNSFIQQLHDSLKIDDERFTMRYQKYVLRFKNPVDLFKDIVISFMSANTNNLVVGVNMVAPEHGETSMKDYRLHMLMFQFCHQKFPKVKYSLHAGELAMGQVAPESLTWHIRDAIHTAKANRIGHGVDMPYEKNSYELLRYMSQQKIPVEINLVSNRFILQIKEDKHPIKLYHQFKVPMVISTDDAGVLRTSLTEQYVLLAKSYPFFSYSDIKQIVLNSMDYSFIKETALKQKLRQDLLKRFQEFEEKIP
ncbi:adenosine deaminase [Aquirufa aurantiipilula]|uniref:adenosine deaminase n=1 Tax=Aquirufa aurantiipilula TaxID=2696561 RepID=A0ABT6BK20_9BACT|nr:adenosine deaminase [Aquirufa aurantiipilula]MDF5690709.1 adenosine deaminase [Aquirufa aurantiipilula]